MGNTLFEQHINRHKNMLSKKLCKKKVIQRVGKGIDRITVMCPAKSFEGKLFDTTADEYIAVRMRKIREIAQLARYLGGDELVKKILVHIKAISANKRPLHRFHLEEERRIRRKGKKGLC